jgi:hypothetical protein
MKRRPTIIIVVLIACTAATAGPASTSNRQGSVRITWVNRNRFPPRQRKELRRLLIAAVEGHPLGPFVTRDSRPQILGARTAELERGHGGQNAK